MGIGGLALGALLAHAGYKVIIFEQHYVPGGYGHTFRQGRFSFCAELHYVWDCGPGERVFQMLDKEAVLVVVVTACTRALNSDKKTK